MINENSSMKFDFKFYKLIMLLAIISFIPLINLSNKAVAGLLFSVLVLIFNFQCFKKGYSKVKIVLNTLIGTVIYYILALLQTFLTYINIINEITNRVEGITDSIDVGFTLVDGKLILMFIPLSITSLIFFKKDKLNEKLLKLAFILNMIIFITIIY